MTGAEVRAALRELRVDMTELAWELDVSQRTVRRWCDNGCGGPNAYAIQAALRFNKLTIAWRKGQIAIGLYADCGVVALTDFEAALRSQMVA